jgi:diguanylate cyclase (GGDEF)-like protein/PAS domain S-box-containing protein
MEEHQGFALGARRRSLEASEYSIHDVSEKLGIPIQKLRRWDDQGVLVARRTDGGHRRYSKELIDRLFASSTGSPQSTSSEELETVKRSLDEKRRIIQLLLESEQRYRDLVETTHDLIWTTDSQGRFTYLKTASRDIFGLTGKELLGRCFFDFEARPSHIANRRFLATLKRAGEVRNHVTHLITTTGLDRWIGINARIIRDDRGTLVGIRGTARDITEQHNATLKIEHLALHDALTDLPNRVALQQTVEIAIQEGKVGAVLFLDIDHFKYINDNFGHQSGDQLIVGVSGVLKELLRECDSQLYRIGGDEFAVHLPGSLRKDAIAVAERALEGIRHYRFHPPGHSKVSNLTVSIGIGLYPFHGGDLVGLLSNVDIALYQAKDHGRNRYVLSDQDANNIRSTHKRVHWAKRLREALDEDRLVLFWQPVVRLSDQQPVHHEILVRIKEQDGTIVTPGHFIELAESLNLIQEIDMRVVQKLLAHMESNHQENKRLRYFVNLSRVSISDQHWIRRFHRMLADSRVNPNQLVFEITETAAMSEVDVTLSFIRQLKEMGCRFALDDFGAGFSSFYYLKRFDVDYLKIDGNFIRDLATEEASRIFVKALNDVAKGLNKQVIAEWVESQEVLNALMAMGTQFGQGFLFKRPVPLEDHLLIQPSSPAAA